MGERQDDAHGGVEERRMEPNGAEVGFVEQGTPGRGLPVGHKGQGSWGKRAGIGQDMPRGLRLVPR